MSLKSSSCQLSQHHALFLLLFAGNMRHSLFSIGLCYVLLQKKKKKSEKSNLCISREIVYNLEIQLVYNLEIQLNRKEMIS